MVSTTAIYISTLASTTPKCPSSGAPLTGTSSISATVALIWNTVLSLPSIAAAITLPPPAATSRKPEIMNSRASITMHTQAGMRSDATSTTMALMTSSLSAIGSANLPKLVTRCRARAIFPSSVSVKHAAR